MSSPFHSLLTLVSIRSGFRRAGGTALLAALVLGTAWPTARAADRADDFGPLVKLAPFVVNGQQLAISIHARNARDRRYAEGFAEEVVKVVYEAVTPETGKGLVIIGAKGEPHPIVVFRKFLALADAGKLDPAVAARGPELFAMLNRWRDSANDAESGSEAKTEKAGGDDAKVDLEFDKIVTALPLPLEGIGAKLYQLAWAEKFDEAKIEAKLRALRAADLERDWFTHFDWVFYLPPKRAFDHVLDELISDALKEDDTGFFARMAIKGVMVVVKPKIRRAIESVRQGLMLMTVAQARAGVTPEEAEALMGAYVDALMPFGRSTEGSEHERAVQAVREQVRKNAEKAKAADAKAAAATSAEPDVTAAPTEEPPDAP